MEKDFERIISERLDGIDVCLESYFHAGTVGAIECAVTESGATGDELSSLTDKYISQGNDLGILVAGVAKIGSAGPAILKKLGQENLPVDVSVLISVLGDIRYSGAYDDIVSYLDTPQNHHALIALSKIEYTRTAEYIRDQILSAVAETGEDCLKMKDRATYEHPLLTTLDVIISESLDASGMEQTAKNLLVVCLEKPDEIRFMKKAIHNLTYSHDDAKSLLERYRKLVQFF